MWPFKKKVKHEKNWKPYFGKKLVINGYNIWLLDIIIHDNRRYLYVKQTDNLENLFYIAIDMIEWWKPMEAENVD